MTAVPRLLTFEGRLADGNGSLLSGTVNITFSIYTQKIGGTAVWAETHAVTLESGIHAGNFAVCCVPLQKWALFLGSELLL